MAFDLLSGETTARDWSLGGLDLPKSTKGYAPNTFWGRKEMENKLAELMSKPKGWFGDKPSRDEAIKMLADYMKVHKIGPTESAGVGWQVGSILLPAKEQKVLLNKIDDVRYDVRKTRAVLGAALFAVAGGMTVLGLANMYSNRARG